MPVILYNGSVIASSNGTIIHNKWGIDSELCKKILGIAINYDLRPLVYCVNHRILLGLEEKVFSLSKFNDVSVDLNGLRINYLKKPEDLDIDSAVAILLYGASSLSPFERNNLLTEIRKFVRANLFGDRIEISPKNADKGVALVELAKLLNWDLNRIMAVGDNINDKEMLEVAGISVALANSPSEVTELADYVTRHSFGSGVIEAIEYGIIHEKWRVKQKIGKNQIST